MIRHEDDKWIVDKGTWACPTCGEPSCSAGTGHLECAEHWKMLPVETQIDYWLPPLRINRYQAGRLLSTLEDNPLLNTGDWWGELLLLLKNQGVTREY